MTDDSQLSSSADAADLLRRRVASFSLVFGATLFVSLLSRLIVLFVWREHFEFLPTSFVPLQAIATWAMLGTWVLTRNGPKRPRFVRMVEAAGVSITALAFVAIAAQITALINHAEPVRDLARAAETSIYAVFAILAPLVGTSIILTYIMVLRAAFVPTSVRHTVALTSAVGVPLAWVAWSAGIESGSPLPFATPAALAVGAIWQWGFTVVICAAISRVIYGLRAEVREAQRLGQYKLEALIGEGGMGMVYRASHEMLRRPTAVKLLSPDRAGDHALERFEREVRLTAELTHPNTVTIFDYGRTAEGVLYYAMELLDGADLGEVVQIDGPQPAARVVHILAQVAGALGEAHSIGLIHRDIKPSNVMLCRQGGELDVAKVVDFGLVQELAVRHPDHGSQESDIAGTPLYMAPEILSESEAAGPASDLYALGALGYFLLTGTHVFSGDSVVDVLRHHLQTAPEPLSARLGDEIPPCLERLVLDCLSKSPSDRPRDAAELRARLEACDEVPLWTQGQARRWWQVYGPSLAERHSQAERPLPSRGKEMLAIDFARRTMGATE